MNRNARYVTGVFIVFAMFLFGLVINFKSKNQPTPGSSNQSSTGEKTEVKAMIAEVETLFQDRGLITSDRCVPALNRLYDKFYNLKVGQFDLDELKSSAPKVVKDIFNLRMWIRENLQQTYLKGGQKLITPECAFAHRKVFRAMRVLEDYIGMLSAGVFNGTAGIPEDKYYRVFKENEDSPINFMWNEANDRNRPANVKEYVPRSGDVLLSRGSASVSAAIARITDEDSNFSHAGIVYVDPSNGNIETIEAHIEVGTKVAKWEEYSDMKARSVVFRFRDDRLSDKENAEIAHEAATRVKKIVDDYHSKYGKNPLATHPNPCYDFGMTIDNPTDMKPGNGKCLFCSEVVSLAFSLARNKHNVPTFKSSINPKNPVFLKSIGVKVKETFAPADLEIDPYFDMVLEWRDYIRIHKTHRMDAILTAVYNWMDAHNYQFHVPGIESLKNKVGFGLRRIPFVNDQLLGLKEKFPLNMAKSALDGMVMLDEVSNQLVEVIIAEEDLKKKSLTPREMIDLLNQWRETDLADYGKGIGYNSKSDKLAEKRVHHIFREKRAK